VKTLHSAGENGFVAMRRIKRWHQRKHADGEQHWRDERADEAKSRHQSDCEISERGSPSEKNHRLEEIIDRTTVEREAALEESRRVQHERAEQQEIIDTIIPAKTFSPKKHRVNHAYAVKKNSEQEKMPV
jgi:hypothetical protein